MVSYDLDVGALNGHFNAPGYPVASVPGIPGIMGSTGNFAEEIITRLHFPAAEATVNIEGVTRWDRSDDYPNLNYWTPDPTSW